VQRCAELDSVSLFRNPLLADAMRHVDPFQEFPMLSVRITAFGNTGQHNAPCQVIPLTATFPYFGGVRWWFSCPCDTDGSPCQRRVRKLYLPPGATAFGCRSCHKLTYTSAQTHDHRINLLAKKPIDALLAIRCFASETWQLLVARALVRLIDTG